MIRPYTSPVPQWAAILSVSANPYSRSFPRDRIARTSRDVYGGRDNQPIAAVPSRLTYGEPAHNTGPVSPWRQTAELQYPLCPDERTTRPLAEWISVGSQQELDQEHNRALI